MKCEVNESERESDEIERREEKSLWRERQVMLTPQNNPTLLYLSSQPLKFCYIHTQTSWRKICIVRFFINS